MFLLLYALFGIMLGLSLGVAYASGQEENGRKYFAALIVLLVGQAGTIFTAYAEGKERGHEQGYSQAVSDAEEDDKRVEETIEELNPELIIKE